MLHYLAAAGLLLKVVTLRNSNYTFSYPFLMCLLYIKYHKANYFLIDICEMEEQRIIMKSIDLFTRLLKNYAFYLLY